MIAEIIRATKGRRLWFAKCLVYDFFAALWRRCLRRTTFIAVTGSFGKSTTKECLAAALSTRWPIVKTVGNANGFDRVCRTIFAARPWHRFVVIEVGTERPGMIRHWARVVNPDIAVIVGVGGAHSLSFATLEAIAEEKVSLLKGLRPGGLAVLNGDDARVVAAAGQALPKGREVVWFGSSPSFEMTAHDIKAQWPERLSFTAQTSHGSVRCETQFVGEHWVRSMLAALTVASRLGVPLEEAAHAMERIAPLPGRVQPVLLPNGAVILRDDTNSCLDAFKTSLAVLKDARHVRRVFVSNGYTEDPANSRQRFIHLGELAATSADVVVFFGQYRKQGRYAAIQHGVSSENAHIFKTMRETADFLRTEIRKNDLVLLKGRFSSHICRLLFAQVTDITCWVSDCHKRIRCERCQELGASPEVLARYAPLTQFEETFLSLDDFATTERQSGGAAGGKAA
ncbi:MAG: UDP-N-acetylmuramoyl-tripeptide--D-alanyl-D-alanine ligase [Acidobacteria bacterium]|nr:UDP-N-acetylmuramoyl-tripeptide--D-alanyl-D-alanine ligase [Acidobacteriota bacterium]